MSKAERVVAAEAAILNVEQYLFDTFRIDLIKSGVGENEDIIRAIDILRNETFETLSAKKLVLNQKYLKKLKTLSILSYFYECKQYSLVNLSRLLALTQEECINYLLEANIHKLISVKINQQDNKISIVSSKIRERQSSPLTGKICSGKLHQIKQKNNSVENSISRLIELVNPSKQQQEQLKPKDFLSRYLQSHH